MEIDEIKKSVNEYIDNRLKNPYFASVLAVWAITNRVLLFGIFNFEKDTGLNEKIAWIHHQFKRFDIWIIPGFFATVIWAFFWGFFAMIIFNKINGWGKYVYKFINKSTINLLQKIEPQQWVSAKEFGEIESKLNNLENEINKKKAENNNLLSEIENISKSNNENKSTKDEIMKQNTEKDDTIKELQTKLNVQEAELNDRRNLEKSKLHLPVDLLPSEFFKGKWRNDYQFPDGRNGSEIFEIIDGNKYIIDGKHVFNIEGFSVVGDKVSFTKKGVGNNAVARNDLQIINTSLLRGIEGKRVVIAYNKI